jgi:2-amino-4-hydroxy-6-hydroxymethyldihydropteridine diphosphokinase
VESNRAIIGLGSNIHPTQNMAVALVHLKKHFEVVSVSSFSTTKPIGIVDQPDFLNGVVLIKTTHSQLELIKLLKQIEDEMGRDRTGPKFGPRIIDLDLLIWNGEVVDKDYHTREFLRIAVSELSEKP